MILLALVYFGLAALGCALIISSTLRWARVAMVVVLPILAFAVWQSAQPPTGWPAHAAPPKQAEFKWAAVREPDQLTRDPGEIDLWLTPPGATHPRAYRLPYTRQLHKQAEAATRAVKGGVPVGIRKVAIRKGAHASKYVLYRLPPPAAPVKR